MAMLRPLVVRRCPLVVPTSRLSRVACIPQRSVHHAAVTPLPPLTLLARRPRTTAAAAAVAAGGVAGIARLLAPSAATCETAKVAAPSKKLVRTIADIREEEGKYRTALRIVWRCLELLCMLGPVLATLPLLRTRLRARWLRLLVRTLERCGPVGIKWGQWASTRYDIFEDDLCDALSALTNAAPVHSIGWSRQVFREEMGSELEAIFTDFSPSPVASGSIGQVHIAYLKVAHGDQPAGAKVAVKIQHPGLAERLGIDMAILMGAADALGSVKGLYAAQWLPSCWLPPC
jgi:aarF domain-containing kinase